MDHGYFRDRISAWLDGELPPYEAQVVGEHLQECDECRALLERLKQVDSLVERHSQIDGGDDYWEGRARKIEAELGFGQEKVTDVRRQKSSGLAWKLTAAAASIALLTFIGIHQDDIFKQQEAQKTIVTPGVSDTSVARRGQFRRDSVEAAAKSPAVVPTTLNESTTQAAPEAAGINTDATKPAAQHAAPPTAATEEKQAPAKAKKSDADQSTAPKSTPQLAPVTSAPTPVGRGIISDSLSLPAEQFQAILPDSLKGTIEGLAAEREQRPSLALSTKPTPSAFEATPELDLAGWIKRRDSLENLWAALESQRGRLAIAKGRNEAALADPSLVERELLEAHYNVGRLARGSDPADYDAAVLFLKNYLKQADAQYHVTAQEYLDRLAPDSSDTR